MAVGNILILSGYIQRAKKVKSITAREIFTIVPEVKEQLWGGEFRTDGYFVSTVGEHPNEDVNREYKKSGKAWRV